ncbi:MAG TPA: ankyrin repeat domain-containing protein, partial [Candidatus Babeliales bacterium]|nr:ankyrin repeat domain-containing protein [Candidatus Babeliales bacterium]
MNFLIKKRSSIAQSLFLAAHLLIGNLMFAMKNSYSPNDRSLRKLRMNLFKYGALNSDGTLQDTSSTILNKQQEEERYGECHNYAISKKLGLVGKIPETLPIAGLNDWHTTFKFTENYCKEVAIPKKGDLITYYDDSTSTEVLHTGLVLDNDMVESKWSTFPEVLAHPTFHIPANWGNHVRYHRIIKPTEEIIEDIKNKIPKCNDTKESCTVLKNDFLFYAQQGDHAKMQKLWQTVMCIDKNTKNSGGQSLLMIGAKTNNPTLVKKAIQLGIDPNQQDKNSKTALDLAEEKDHTAIIKILQPYDTTPFLHRIVKHMAQPSKAA